MVNRPRALGTLAETAVTRTARTRGFPYAERVALHGRNDVGDLLLCPGVVVEVKGGDAARHATDRDIDRWLDETDRERRNAGAAAAFLVVQRRGVGTLNAHRWWAWWRTSWLPIPVDLWPATVAAVPVRMTLGDALTFLRTAGYGDPLTEHHPTTTKEPTP